MLLYFSEPFHSRLVPENKHVFVFNNPQAYQNYLEETKTNGRPFSTESGAILELIAFATIAEELAIYHPRIRGIGGGYLYDFRLTIPKRTSLCPDTILKYLKENVSDMLDDSHLHYQEDKHAH